MGSDFKCLEHLKTELSTQGSLDRLRKALEEGWSPSAGPLPGHQQLLWMEKPSRDGDHL